MEQTLDQTTIKEIETALLTQKKQIEAELLKITSKDNHKADQSSAIFPEYGDKADENAQELSDYSTNVATEKVFEKTLEDIAGALKRIHNNAYGICKYCHEPIAKKRLLARPTANSCISCKTKLQENE